MKRKPRALKVVAGTLRRDRDNPHEPDPSIEPNPSPPAWLDELARQEWCRVVRELVDLGLLTVLDTAALAAYATAYGRWVACELAIKKNGLTYETTSQQGVRMIRLRPEVRASFEAMREMRQYMTEFGMTPASRASVCGLRRDELDPLGAFLMRGRRVDDDTPRR